MSKALVALLTVLVVLGFTARGARACLNEVLKENETNQLLAAAQAEVDRGEIDRARDDAGRVAFGPRLLWAGYAGELQLKARAMRIRAVADARDPEVARGTLESDEILMSDFRRERGAEDPVLDAEYAEILARIPGREDEARTILASLSARDLVGTPWAYATLARLSKSDPKAAEEARAACARIGGEAGLCEALPSRPPRAARATEPANGRAFLAPGLVVGGVFVVGAGSLAIVIARRRRRIAEALAD